MTRKQRRVLALTVILAFGIAILGTGIMDADWMAMQWHGNLDNGDTWTLIPKVFVLHWYWAYVFTVCRLIFGSMIITAVVCVFAGMVSKRIFVV